MYIIKHIYNYIYIYIYNINIYTYIYILYIYRYIYYDNHYSPVPADKMTIEHKCTNKSNNNERKKENINTGKT